MMEEEIYATKRLLCRLVSESGEVTGDVMDLPITCTLQELKMICNALLKQEEPASYLFSVNDKEIVINLEKALEGTQVNTEAVLDIVYRQEAVFKVRPVTRCTSSIPGHAEPVLTVSFSPDGKHLASGSGDTTVRFWDINTQNPSYTCKGHKHWVLHVSWSPDSNKLASGCKNGKIMIWNPVKGVQIGNTLQGHRQWITSFSWEPYHRNPECRYLASSSKDGDVRIWDTVLCKCTLTISGHTKGVTAVRWGGAGLIYTASQDRTVKVWRAEDGILCRSLEGHAHWVNTLALNTDYVLRIGAFDPVKDAHKDTSCPDKKKSQNFALTRYQKVIVPHGERLVSGSDDFTLFLWDPERGKKPLARLVGHQQLINDVRFSPDGRIIASASFDKSIKLWDGRHGAFICTLRGHVQPVYMTAFSADSRLLVSGSADSTLKLWNLKTNKLEIDLPGHADQVFTVDWSTDGLKVASGGKDKLLRLWQN